MRTTATLANIILAANPLLGPKLLEDNGPYQNWANLPFQEWIENYPDDALCLSDHLETRLLVVADPATTPLCRHRLIYDGRNRNFLEEKRIQKECAILMDADGYLRAVYSNPDCLRQLEPLNTWYSGKKAKKKPLWQLLKLKEEFPDPRNYREVALALSQVPQGQLPNVVINFVSFRRGNKMWSNSGFSYVNKFSEKYIFVEAVTSPNYGLMFRLKKPRAPAKMSKRDAPEELPPCSEPDLFQKCRSSCAKFDRSGLNLAYDLGLITRKELKSISEKLAFTVAAFVVQYGRQTAKSTDSLDVIYNNERPPKFLTYADSMCTRSEPVDFAKPFSSEQTTCFAHWLWHIRRTALVNARRAILQELLTKLEQFPSKTGSLYKKCTLELEKCIREQPYVLFCSDDSDLHHLKGFVAQFFYSSEANQKKKIEMRLTERKSLVALTSPDFRVFNLKQYLDIEEDQDLKQVLTQAPQLHTRKRPRPNDNGVRNNYEMCTKFGETVVSYVMKGWIWLGSYLLNEFDYELHSTNYAGMAGLSNKAVESKYLASSGPLHQGREKLKPYYVKMLRQSLRGGFHFSARLFLHSGSQEAVGLGGKVEPIFLPGPDGEQERAASIWEYDINSSYGFSASTAQLPGSFCVGFVAEDFALNPQGFTVSTDGNAPLMRHDGFRSETYEFLAVFYTLLKILDATNTPVRSVYSNFHPRGLFGIGKCYVDLAVVFEDGRVKLFNFDPAYTHGCLACPPLQVYVGNQSHAEVRSNTTDRDVAIRDWMNGCGLQNFDYEVVSDCCDLPKQMLDYTFLQRPELQHLKQSCPPQRTLSGENLLKWFGRHRNNQNFSYIAWIEGAVPSEGEENCTPVLLHPCILTSAGQEMSRSTGNSAVLVTRDYLEYLQDEFGFQVSAIKAALIFGRDHLTNQVYKELADLRYSASSPVETNFLKKVLNLSLGYTALNAAKGARTKYYYCPMPPGCDNPARRHVLPNLGITERGCEDILLGVEYRKVGATQRRPDNLGYLPFYTTVIERGRMRLAELIVLLQKYLPPHTFRLLFCNTDNLHFVCSNDNWESLVRPNCLGEFQQKKSTLISEAKTPGLFKLEWCTSGHFKYVTAATQNWSLSSDNFQAQKWSGISKLTPRQSFEYSCKLLKNELFSVEQVRRQDKVNSLGCETKIFTFNKK